MKLLALAFTGVMGFSSVLLAGFGFGSDEPVVQYVVQAPQQPPVRVVPSAPGVPATPAAPQDKDKKMTVMQRKLKSAQSVLEGLAIKDFNKIEKSADELMLCVKEATWRINDTEKYLMYSNDFIKEIEALQKTAQKKNIDGATLAYVEMTLTCVKCHEHLRDTRIGAAPSGTTPEKSGTAGQ